MVSQEAEEVLAFVEEETEEALLPLMSWRAEVKVTMPRVVRGGVLCDEVGYGKTAIILGLIDAQYHQDSLRLQQAPLVPGQIAAKATLLLIPHNVFKQWADEIRKFLGAKYKVLRLPNAKALSKTSVKQMREADIILVSWSMFNSPAYYQIMRYFTGTPKVPVKAGRNFDSWFKDASRSLRRVVQVLQEQGPEGYLKDVWARRLELQRTQANSTYVPSRRLRGAAFLAARAQPRTTTENGTFETDAPVQSLESSRASVSQNPDRVGPCPSPEDPSANPTVQPPEDVSPPAGSSDQQAVAPDDDSSGESDNDRDVQGEEEDDTDADADKPVRKKGKPVRKKSKCVEPSKTCDKKQEPWDDRKGFNIPAPTSQRIPSLDDMTYLPLHAFSFNRIVVDEYSYTREERNLAILSLISRSKWILSGTPALEEFADVKDIARHLGIHLGIDNDGDLPTSNSRLKGARRNQTALEAFEMHQPPRSMAWYRNRRDHAQAFLDRFARQNPVDVSSLPLDTRLVVSDFLPQEETIYQALYDRFVTDEGRVRKITGSDLDALSTTLNVLLLKSQSPVEALLRCATAAGMIEHPWNVDNCQKRIELRQKIREEHWDKLTSFLKMAFMVLNLAQDQISQSWETLLGDASCDNDCDHDRCFGKRVGDAETMDLVRVLLGAVFERPDLWSQGVPYEKLKENVEEKLRVARPTKAQETQLRKVYVDEPAESQPSTDGTESGNKTSTTNRNFILLSDEDYQAKLQVWKIDTVLKKDLVCEIFKTIEQIVECSREMRFFTIIQDLQIEQSYNCDKCLGSFDFDSAGRDGLTVIRSCGHRLCQDCMALVNEQADKEAICAVDRCRASAYMSKQVSGRSVEDASAAQESSKLNSMVDIINNIPAEEKALLFVQFEDAMTYASRALDAAGIHHCVAKSGRATAITDFVLQKAKSVPQQQDEDTPMVDGDEQDLDDQEDGGQKKRKRGRKLTEEEKKNLPRPKVLILRLGSEMAAGL
jgi:hypothetical protein